MEIPLLQCFTINLYQKTKSYFNTKTNFYLTFLFCFFKFKIFIFVFLSVHQAWGVTEILRRELVELSVAYKMSSWTLEKYKPVISGHSKTYNSSSICPSWLSTDITPCLLDSVKSNLATKSLPSWCIANDVGPNLPAN